MILYINYSSGILLQSPALPSSLSLPLHYAAVARLVLPLYEWFKPDSVVFVVCLFNSVCFFSTSAALFFLTHIVMR